MSERHQRIVELLQSGADPEGLTVTVRAVMKNNIFDMAQVAKLVAVGKQREDRNNQLSKLRVVMSRVCKEMGLPKFSILERDTGYVVRPSTPKSLRGPSKVLLSLQELANDVTHLSLHERQELLERFREILGLSDAKP